MTIYRERTIGGFTNAPPLLYRNRYLNCSDTNWTNGSIATPFLVGELRTMRDVVTPHFRERIRKGELIFNPMSSSHQVSGYSEGTLLRAHGINETCPATHTHYEAEHLSGPWIGWWLNKTGTPITVPVVQLISSTDIADLVTEVSTKVLSDRGKADNNLFESVAEYKQTLDMLRRPQDSLFRFFNKNGKAMKRLSPENAWLAYRYGLKPFINDVTGIISGLSKKTGKDRKSTRSQGEIQKSDIIPADYTNDVFKARINNQVVDLVSVRAVSVDEYVADTASNIGFTTKGLLTLPWELVPYSFVADWFVNVGDLIGALAPAPGYKQLGSALTVRRYTYNLYQIANVTCTSFYVSPPDSLPTSSCYGSLETKTRSAIGSPGLVVKSNFRLDNPTRAADAFALLKQKADRFFKR